MFSSKFYFPIIQTKGNSIKIKTTNLLNLISLSKKKKIKKLKSKKLKLKYNRWRQIWIASTMTAIAQNAQKRLNFIVVPQVRTKMREGKRESNNNKKNTHTHTHTQTWEWIRQRKTHWSKFTCIKYTHTHRHANIFTYRYTFIIQVRVLFDIIFESI